MKKLFITLLLCFASLGALENANAQMYWNQAGIFAGNTNSYLCSRHTTPINITGSFTIEAWVHPTAQNSNMYLISKGSAGAYGLSIISDRPTVFTNGISRLSSKTTTKVPQNKWTHIAATYNSGQNKYEIYVNGILDTSGTAPGTTPVSNTDSLYVGKRGFNVFPGMMDNVRIWNRNLFAVEIARNMRSSLSINPSGSEYYSGMVYSIVFENSNTASGLTTVFDYTFSSNPVANHNVTFLSMQNKLPEYLSWNEALAFDGTGDYAAVPQAGGINVQGTFTAEAWVYLKAYNPGFNQIILDKRNSNSGYSLSINNSKRLAVVINSTGTAAGGGDFPLNRWVHVAVAQGPTGLAKIYIDGKLAGSHTYPAVVSNTDSLFIGGKNFQEGFNGYIDEVRISDYEKTAEQINNYRFASVNSANDPTPGQSDVSFNFDGKTQGNANGNFTAYLRGDTKFSNPNTVSATPISPLGRFDAGNFHKGYRMKSPNKRIPENGTSGAIYDTLGVNSSTAINDINVFLAINHAYDGDIEATLFAPNGDSARIIFDRYTINQLTGDIINLFDDQADSSLASGRYTSFAPRIKPEQSFNTIFGNDNPYGNWILRINDDGEGDVGMLYAWGIQLNGETLVGVEDPKNNSIPSKFILKQNYPNPFNPSTAIKFSIPVKLTVKLRVYDITGREVATLVNKELTSGAYEFLFDGSQLSSGVYFYKLEAGEFIDTKKMILVK